MFLPAYQLDLYKNESEALESVEQTAENLKLSLPVCAVSGEASKKSIIKVVKDGGSFIFVYQPDTSVSVWFSEDYWECDALEDAEEFISSVEGGIPALYWAVFEVREGFS